MNFSANTEWEFFLTENNFIRLSAALKEAVHQFKIKLNQNNTEKISVVICTRNRSLGLQECLQSLTKINDGNFEIIVVDNASDNDET